MPFGYHRAEVIGALLSVLLIWVLAIGLMFTAVRRVMDQAKGDTKETVDGQAMFFVAVFRLGINLVLMTILDHEHGHRHRHRHSHWYIFLPNGNPRTTLRATQRVLASLVCVDKPYVSFAVVVVRDSSTDFFNFVFELKPNRGSASVKSFAPVVAKDSSGFDIVPWSLLQTQPSARVWAPHA